MNINVARLFYCWLILLCVTVISLAWQAYRGIAIESNVLKLLPATEQDSVVQQAVERFGDNLAKKHLLLVGGKDIQQVQKAAQFLFDELEKSGVFPKIIFKVNKEQRQELFAAYSAYQSTLHSASTRQYLKDNDVDGLIKKSIKLLYSPLTPIGSELLRRDPALLFYDYLRQLPSLQAAMQLEDDLLVARFEGLYYILLTLQLPGDAYSLSVQQQVVPLLEHSGKHLLKKFPNSDLVSVGVVKYAHAGVVSARSEISTIGLGSLVGVIVILVFVFKSGIPVVASFVPIIIGFLSALSVCLWLFSSVHVLTLVFGASLIGISIDYTFHFFADRLAFADSWTPAGGVKRIFNGVSLGLITSVIGFAGLCIAPFPGMQQMAVFSSVGLLAAYLTVMGFFPRWISSAGSINTNHQYWVKRMGCLLSLWRKLYRCLPGGVWLLMVSVFAFIGIKDITSNDDIRLLQQVPAALSDEEQRLKKIIGTNPASQFFVVEGESKQDVLDQEQLLVKHLQSLKNAGVLMSFDAISNYLPSEKRQKEDYHLIKTQLINNPQLLQSYQQITGLDSLLIETLTRQYAVNQPSILRLDELLSTGAADAFHHLWIGQTARGYASMVTLQGVQDVAAISALEEHWPAVHFIDQVSDISTLFKQYRERAGKLVLLAYGVIYFFLLLRYGLRAATAIMLAPVIAAVLTVATLALIGEELNIFHSLALLLVLGIGIDYTLFLIEGGSHHNATLLAIVLSATTTILSFGLLALSDTAAIHAFGITVLIGIAGALILSPLVIEFSSNAVDQSKG